VYNFPRKLDDAGLTRISVRSTRDYYLVRSGSGPAVRVRRRGQHLDCECGEKDCLHVLSLRMCGFVGEAPGNDLQAAA
jgi:hypothetical protein